MILTLQLRHSAKLDAAPRAWFLPGDSAERWLTELGRCGLANNHTRLFVVPRSVTDRAPAGLLVVPDRPGSLKLVPTGVGCRLVAGRLFVPVDAALHPPVTDAELRVLCPLPVSFFHPACGLSGFDEESTLRVWDFLETPTQRAEQWNSAVSGFPPMPELSAVLLAQPPSIEDVFGGAEQDIGSDPIVDLPPAPDEPKADPLAKSRRNLARWFAKGVAGAMRQFPHTGQQRTWVNKLEDWANRKLQGVSEQLQKIRNKELHRLLHLLDTNPEAGLRHAIPMNSFAHRGVAPPGGRLISHSLDFNPGQLGGQAGDFWNIPFDLQEVLRRRYREMADREMQLGRHRRAAYIYAQLLGDLVSAANALKRGKLFREAALIYEEHLRNPLEAARCLAEGGLLVEAIERYEKLERWLEVADLYEKLGNRPAAEAAVRRVVNDRLAQDDILGAAKLVEERLAAADEALEMLLRAYPDSRQGVGCIGAAFQLLARLGRHEVALELVAQLRRDPIPPPLRLPILATLAGPARDYPHETVRRRAADLSRVLIAQQLGNPATPTTDAWTLIDNLVRLAPQDRLLARDGNRYLADRRSAEFRFRRITPPPLPANQPTVVRRMELPRQIEWLELRSEWHWFYALGATPKRLTLVRGVWDGGIQSLSWEWPGAAAKSGLVFEATGERGRAVALARPGGPIFATKTFPAVDAFFAQECIAGTPAWLPTEGYPFAFGEESVWSVHLASGQAILSCHNKRGQLQRTLDVTTDLLHGADRTPETRLCIAALSSGVALALGNRLVLTRGDGGLTRIELPGQATRLLPTFPHTRAGVAVMLHHGAVMHWVGAPGLIELDRDVASPLGAFVPGGPLVLIAGSQGMLLDVDSRGVKSVCRFDVPGQPIVGVMATASVSQFATLSAGGEMTVYSVPV